MAKLRKSPTLRRTLRRKNRRRVDDPLIHVGIRKAASTFLQHRFNTAVNVRTATMEELELRLFDAVIDGADPESFVRGARARFRPYWNMPHVPGSKYIVSNERFAINPRMMKFVPNDEHAPAAYERFWAMQIGSLKACFPEGRVLMLTRSPASWVKSVYSQAVRGAIAHRRFPGFVRARSEYLRQNLQYQRMRERFIEAFGEDRVLLLPQELLKSDPERFFEMLSDFSGISMKPLKDNQIPREAHNASPSPRELDVLVNSWRVLRLLDKYGRRPESAFYQRYVDPRVKKVERVYKTYYRNNIEFRLDHTERAWDITVASLDEPTVEVDRFDEIGSLIEEVAEQCRFLTGLPGYESCGSVYDLGV